MSASPASAGRLGGEPRPPVPFENLLRAHRRELLVHCYRMLAPESLLMNVSGMPRGGGACGRGSGIGLRGPRPRRQEASREPPEGRQDDGNDRDDVAEESCRGRNGSKRARRS